MENLDLYCAKFGRKLSAIDGVDEELLQDSLSVLEEQGLYAFFLYLKAHGKEPGKKVMDECYKFFIDNPVMGQKFQVSTNNVFDAVLELGQSINDLIFARELLIQSLIYARYHSKAKGRSVSKT
ncbi:hypothetical protein [Methanothrix sp.]|jgi:hypothetical protein|uniref:hypothetical protein n=1 Tax=Methanothrix sp. TaxID=90426 RepID=UPI001BD47E85